MFQWILLAASVGLASASFQQLRENCRTEDGLGTCVQSPFCCQALGGHVLDVVSTKLVSKGAMPPSLARVVGDDRKGCSYEGVCCVLPELLDPDCSICGLKGNGDISKAERPDVEAKTTTTPPPGTVKKFLTPRIVRGNDADKYEWCWQVALMNATGLFGGGALISRNWVVTAAHKVAGRFLDEFIVVLGEYDFRHEIADNNVYYATALNVKVNPYFNPEMYHHNLALIRIPDAPCFEDSVCPVCLSDDDVTFVPTTTPPPTTTTQFTTPTTTTTTTYAYGDPTGPLGVKFSVKNAIGVVNFKQNRQINTAGGVREFQNGQDNDFAKYVCYMTGWGSTGEREIAPRLQEAYMQIITDDECKDGFRELGVKNPTLPFGSFCGAEPSWSRGSCYGDGGGPLVCQNRLDHTWELWGVISLGTNMCMPTGEQGPTIFADVGEWYDWIVESVHESLPDPAGDTFGRKAYRVPECGKNLGKPCPQPAPLHRRSGLPDDMEFFSQRQRETLTF